MTVPAVHHLVPAQMFQRADISRCPSHPRPVEQDNLRQMSKSSRIASFFSASTLPSDPRLFVSICRTSEVDPSFNEVLQPATPAGVTKRSCLFRRALPTQPDRRLFGSVQNQPASG